MHSKASSDRMTTDLEETIVAFGIDAGYTPHLAVAIASVVANAPGARFRFVVMNDGVSDSDKRKVEASAPGQTFNWFEIDDTRLLEMPQYHHITRAGFFRFGMPTFAPAAAKRVIYLDSDIVVLGDIRELAKVDLDGMTVGAVFDVGMDSEAFARLWSLPPARLNYFNSGVMVIDMEKLREGGGFEPALKAAMGRWDDCRFGDQCALNVMFWNRWKRLDPTWNVQRRMVVNEGNPCYATAAEMRTNTRPNIIHYTETNKPWSRDAFHPYVWAYYRYLRRTRFWKSVNKSAQTTPLKHLRRYLKTQFALQRLQAYSA